MHRIRRNAVAITAVCIVVLAQVVVLIVATGIAGADPQPAAVDYRPPVDDATPLVDSFRPPPTPYAAGNRGVDYGTTPGQPVVAAAAGEVAFAGRIGSTSHVVILHADGLRTSYSFLATAGVRRGDEIGAGDVIGTAREGDLHFGVRTGDGVYLDPLELLAPRVHAPAAHLVPDDDRRPLREIDERNGLVESLRGLAGRVGGAGLDGAAWLRDRAHDRFGRQLTLVEVAASDLANLAVPLSIHLALAAATWGEEQGPCTDAAAAVPPAPAHGPPPHLVVLVAGLGSATGSAAVLDVDTAGLGYRASAVRQFDYRADGRPYAPDDTLGDIGAAGERLAADLRQLAHDHPDAPIDVVAHSQGGLVARAALTSPGAPAIATLVTLATPHQGTDLATAAVGLGATRVGRLGLMAGARLPQAIDPQALSVQQMSERSDFLAQLREGPFAHVGHAVSIAARGDPVVPSFHSHLGGVPNVVVSVGGTTSVADHDRLPGSGEATREIALALAGRPPTCRSLVDHLEDVALARIASQGEDALGLGLTAGALRLGSGSDAAGGR